MEVFRFNLFLVLKSYPLGYLPAILALCALCRISAAQSVVTDTGKVDIIQDRQINELLSKHIEINSKASIKGYRIKIHFGSDKTKAREVKTKFIALFPNVPAYEKYDQPNFNIRVGDFRSKLEAYKFFKEVQTEFPSAFLVQDYIEFPELTTDDKK